MNDEKQSAALVKEGIKLLQKRTNPVELFVQKRVRASGNARFTCRMALSLSLVGLREKVSTFGIDSAYLRL